MSDTAVFSRIASLGVVPVIAIDSADAALPLADALLAGGLPVIEVTFRTAAAAGVIRTIAQRRPEMIVGAGTVLTLDNLHAAIDAGAQFALAPGCNPRVVEAARAAALPFIPGVVTPSDIEAALDAGCTTLKFFPAEPGGGVKMIAALAAPYRHMGVSFVPTGGVTPANLRDYLAAPGVAAVGGTWLAKPADLAAGAWDVVRARCAAAVQDVRESRRTQHGSQHA